jgi:hypothetical protein
VGGGGGRQEERRWEGGREENSARHRFWVSSQKKEPIRIVNLFHMIKMTMMINIIKSAVLCEL